MDDSFRNSCLHTNSLQICNSTGTCETRQDLDLAVVPPPPPPRDSYCCSFPRSIKEYAHSWNPPAMLPFLSHIQYPFVCFLRHRPRICYFDIVRDFLLSCRITSNVIVFCSVWNFNPLHGFRNAPLLWRHNTRWTLKHWTDSKQLLRKGRIAWRRNNKLRGELKENDSQIMVKGKRIKHKENVKQVKVKIKN